MLDFRRNVLWIIIGGGSCLFVFVFVFLAIAFRQDGNSKSTPLSPTISPSAIRNDSPDYQQDTRFTQNPAVPSKQSAHQADQVSISPAPSEVPPAPDQANLEIHRKIVAGLNSKIREQTRGLYAGAFQQLSLPVDLQEKVLDILTQQQKQLEQQAFEAAQSGSLPAPPSPEAIRAQQVQQDQQLRSALGDAGFAQFNQYRATIPDRVIINSMNQEGANLSESQSQQLLEILTQARQEIIGQAPITQNLNSMPSEQVGTIIQQQQVLLQQAVNNRVQNILTPEQATTLQEVFSQHSIPKGQ